MKQTAASEQRFFPWVHEAHALKLAVLGGQLDADTSVSVIDRLDPRGHTVDLSAAWQRATLDLQLSVPSRVVTQVVGAHERDDPPLAILVALRCDRTRVRRQVGLLNWNQGSGGRFELTLELRRDEFADVAEIDAFVIRSRAATHDTPGVASLAGARLASARSWQLLIDKPIERAGNYLDIQYRSFAQEPSIPPPQRASLYRLDLAREDPILYLNADHEHVRAVLDAKGTTGPRARARELLFERIQAGVWTQLFLSASTRFVEDGDHAYAWERSVLDQWLVRLYPDEVDDAARRERLCHDHRQLPSLLVQLDAVIQVSGELAQLAAKLADEIS
ncbi:hypothetical protein DB30_03823 [Enhygromyxa salina]|uniref:Uncharacterized protein n=1 Tax=Enhygromyxa salina TaxID=215803 RepID=A0A0C2DHX2_9BACT|nr:hypothetical protein [Enhygromyxa salina]KIG19267.1 hypothetical protein DB30_03823 [Enhygromyxa salina]